MFVPGIKQMIFLVNMLVASPESYSEPLLWVPVAGCELYSNDKLLLLQCL